MISISCCCCSSGWRFRYWKERTNRKTTIRAVSRKAKNLNMKTTQSSNSSITISIENSRGQKVSRSPLWRPAHEKWESDRRPTSRNVRETSSNILAQFEAKHQSLFSLLLWSVLFSDWWWRTSRIFLWKAVGCNRASGWHFAFVCVSSVDLRTRSLIWRQSQNLLLWSTEKLHCRAHSILWNQKDQNSFF